MLIDTHAHLMFPEFDVDREEVVLRAREAGLRAVVNVGCGIESSRRGVEMARADRSGFLYATLGLHPYEADQVTDELMGEWEKWILEDRAGRSTRGTGVDGAGADVGVGCIVAIGETGLDYLKSQIDHEQQKMSFRKHLELAMKVGLPLIVHNRGADEDCLGILKEFFRLKAVFHCYGSTLEFAKRVWEAGFMTSFTGIITFPSAKELREVVKEVPLDKFMIETDSPYLAPQAYRGKRNEPAYVVEVVKMIAEVKGMGVGEVEKVAVENTEKFFAF